MPDTLPLQQMVLYKHGVGSFTRQGTVAGRELELPFRASEVDDALKSLTALTLDGGQVIAIHYQTPENKRERLAEIPFSLRDDHSFFDLLRGGRGALVSLRLRNGYSVQGRVVGVEEHPQGREHSAALVLLTGPGSVEQIATEDIARLQLDDETVAHDLESLLDASRSEEARRTVRIELSEAGRQVQVSYVVPSPVWRVSYRLVGVTEGQDGAPASCLLQGWGIFDNRLDEDLADVDVTLVAGQPVSFRYDLTSSVIPERRLVRDEARVAAGPVEFAGAVEAYPPVPAPPPMAAAPAMARPMRSMARAPYSLGVDALADSTAAPAEGRELDELFEYRVGGVSVRRGESVMVPVVQHRGSYRRELLYNGAKQPSHPVVSVRLLNESGLTLERGPVTVVEDGQYRGEAIVPFTKTGAEIVLAFAVELGVKVVEEQTTSTTMTGLELSGSYLLIQEHLTRRTTYILVNNTTQEQVVTVEQAKWGEAELTGTPDPDEVTGEHRRWRVTCRPGAETRFEVAERLLMERRETVLDQNLSVLAAYLGERFLDADTRRRLEVILGLRQRMYDIDRHLDTLRAEQHELGSRQDRLRQNLGVSATNEQEHEIRRRSAEEFRRTQDREEEIERQSARLKADRDQSEQELRAELAKLSD